MSDLGYEVTAVSAVDQFGDVTLTAQKKDPNSNNVLNTVTARMKESDYQGELGAEDCPKIRKAIAAAIDVSSLAAAEYNTAKAATESTLSSIDLTGLDGELVEPETLRV